MQDSLADLNRTGKKKAEKPRRPGWGFSLSSFSFLGSAPKSQPTKGRQQEIEGTRRKGREATAAWQAPS